LIIKTGGGWHGKDPEIRKFQRLMSPHLFPLALRGFKPFTHFCQAVRVKRLANKIPYVTNARVFRIHVPAHPLWKNRNVGELWQDLAQKLGCDANPAAVIEALVQAYCTQPIIIAMYGWSEVPPARTLRSQALQHQVLREFWRPMVKAIEDLSEQPKKSRIILFLAEGGTPNAEVTDLNNQVDPVNPIRLEPLTEINSSHVIDWFGNGEVSPVLRQFLSEDQIETLIDEDIQDWNPDPVRVISQICNDVFALEYGISTLEADWRLAG
ncbi:MAG: hypothetical protein ACHWZW_23760, partial [Spirulina sp.]